MMTSKQLLAYKTIPSLLTFFLLAIPFQIAAGIEEVITMSPLSVNDARYIYPEKLLEIVLSKTESQYGKAKVTRSTDIMKRDRAFLALIEGKSIHVIAEAPRPGWEEKLIPVRIPIRKGLQGYRIFLIHKDHQKELSNVSSLDDLRKFSTG